MGGRLEKDEREPAREWKRGRDRGEARTGVVCVVGCWMEGERGEGRA